MRFTIGGRAVELDVRHVERALADVPSESVQKHAVRVSGSLYPVKQALEAGTGISRSEFTSQTARRLLASLGMEIVSGGSNEPAPASTAGSPRPPDGQTPGAWPWEGQVQSVFAAFLVANGWSVTSMADAATKAPGVDLVARKGDRSLGAEVKGWPSVGYSDPRRAAETKKTQPSTQAGHWYSQALMKALMLLDSHPAHESLVVLPDYPRYRDLASRTRTGISKAGIHVVFVRSDETAECDSWTS